MNPTVVVPVTISSQGYELAGGAVDVELTEAQSDKRSFELALAVWLREIADELESGDDE